MVNKLPIEKGGPGSGRKKGTYQKITSAERTAAGKHEYALLLDKPLKELKGLETRLKGEMKFASDGDQPEVARVIKKRLYGIQSAIDSKELKAQGRN